MYRYIYLEIQKYTRTVLTGTYNFSVYTKITVSKLNKYINFLLGTSGCLQRLLLFLCIPEFSSTYCAKFCLSTWHTFVLSVYIFSVYISA